MRARKNRFKALGDIDMLENMREQVSGLQDDLEDFNGDITQLGETYLEDAIDRLGQAALAIHQLSTDVLE